MAKMFYTLQEAATKLGKSEQQVKDLAASGQLQQFRDKSTLMFKVDQVDAMAGVSGDADGSSALGLSGLGISGGGSGIDLGSSGSGIGIQDTSGSDIEVLGLDDSAKMSSDIGSGIDLASSGSLGSSLDIGLSGSGSGIDTSAGTDIGQSGSMIPLMDTGGTDEIDLGADTDIPDMNDPRQRTGVSVFETGEVEPSDPLAQTKVTGGSLDDEELSLESVGSGSGLLDLTRESDDTSLGAELLDEIYPDSSETKGSGSGTAIGSSGVFDGVLSETGASSAVDMDAIEPGVAPEEQGVAAEMIVTRRGESGGYMAGLTLLAAMVALVIGLIVIVSSLSGVRSTLTSMMTGYNPATDSYNQTMLYMWVGGLAGVTVLLLGIGWFIDRR